MSDDTSVVIVIFPCGYCEETFSHEQQMIKHVQSSHVAHEEDLKQDESESDTDVQIDVVCENSSIIDTFECHPCRQKFDTEASLAQHIQSVHEEEAEEKLQPWRCKICEKSFKYQTRLKIHLQTHWEARRRTHQCSSCAKTFFTSSDLWSHERIHSGHKYTCNICGKKLASSGSLHNHKKCHDEQKQFECHVCNKQFALKQKLVNHVMTKHEQQKPFECHQCGQGFVHKQSYQAHQRRVHDGTLLHCQMCSKPFHDAGYLKKHLRWHEKVQESRK